MTPVLIIGYGNPLRGDDGIGQHVANRFADSVNITIQTCHQLMPELAEVIQQYPRVVFVDAVLGDRELIEVRTITAAEGTVTLGHSACPEWLLSLAKQLFGSQHEAWLVTIPITDLDYREGLSIHGELKAARAVRLIERLIGSGEPECTKSV